MKTTLPAEYLDKLESAGNQPTRDMYSISRGVLAELVRGYRALLAENEWRPISDAPRDGSEVWTYNGEQGRMKWIEGDGYALWVWADELLSDDDPYPEQPTYFRPLPSPPAQEDVK